MSDLFSDPVDTRSSSPASRLRAPVACTCGQRAECVAVGAGRDLHACRCGRWLARWWCRGHVGELDEGERCPGCGRSRRGETVRVNLIGTINAAKTPHFEGLEAGEGE